MGMVTYHLTGLMWRRTLIMWPNVAQVPTGFIRQEFLVFCYTTGQLNKNYKAKKHVDGNNHLPGKSPASGIPGFT